MLYYVDARSFSNPKPTSFNLKPEGTNLEFRRGQEWVTSTGYKFRFQTDGNLVLYTPQGKAIWATGTENTNADLFAVQRDGNVVLYSRGKPVWATDTGGNPGANFAIQGDGNLVVYSSNGKALFATGTDGGRTQTRSASSDWLNKGQASTSKPGYVDSSIGLNFRTSPSLSGSIISSLANGTNLTILQKVSGGYYNGRNDWYKVKIGNTTGYVAAAYVKEGNSRQFQPINSGAEYLKRLYGSNSSARITRGAKAHRGAIDSAAGLGVNLYALVGGEVIEAWNGFNFGANSCNVNNWTKNGTVAIFNQEMNKTFIYWHLQEGTIDESMKGKTISTGSFIGKEGKTGYACGRTGIHTHVEVREGRSHIDMPRGQISGRKLYLPSALGNGSWS